MKLVMDTDSARTFATVYSQQSDQVLDIRQSMLSLLDQAVLDDTYDAGGALNLLSEDLLTGNLVIRHQADIMDGLTVDVDSLSEELGVERWRVQKQFRKMEQGRIDAGQVLVDLVDWGQTEVTGLDTTIRDFLPDAPPPGRNADIDALILRLDGWLLSAVVDNREIEASVVSAAREADLIALGELMGMPDLATVEVEQAFQVDRFPNDNDDNRTRTEYRDVPLPTSEYGEYAGNWVRHRLVLERRLTRVGAVPTIGELFDFTTYEVPYQHKLGGGDEDSETRYRTTERTAAEIAAEIDKVNAEFNGIDWLPAALIGRGEVSEQLAANRVMQNQLFKLAERLGYDGEGTTLADGVPDPDMAERTLVFLQQAGRRRLAGRLEDPEPIHKARLAVSAGGLEASIELGRQQGLVTPETEANARLISLHLTGHDASIPGFDPNVDLDAEALAAEAPELDVDQLVGLLATAIPPHQLTEQRLYQVLSHVQRAGTVGERMEAIEQVVLGLKTVTTVGEPAMTQHQWLSTLPDKVRTEEFDVDIQGEEFNWLLEHIGVPGYHKSRDWRRGKGKRYFHLVNDAQGLTDDFVVEKIPKKGGWFGQAVMTVAKVAISIYFPPLGVAMAAMDAVIAATQGDWLGAALGAVGAVAAGAAVWASSASATANTAAGAADALAKTSRSIDAIASANNVAAAAKATADTANAVSNFAMAANAGAHAGVGFAKGDVLGGIVNSVAAVGAGASGMGYGNVGQALASGANAVQAVDTTIDAIENDDLAGALAGGLNAGSSLVNLTKTTGVAFDAVDQETVQSMTRWANSAEDAAAVVRSGGALVGAIEDDEWGAAVGGALRAGAATANLIGNDQGAVSDIVFDRTNERAFDAATGTYLDSAKWLSATADLTDAGVAFADGDALGGTALLTSGTTGVLRANDMSSPNLERLDNLTSIANKIVTAPPGIDHTTAMRLIGPEMNRLLGSFENTEPPVRTGSAEQRLAAVRSDRQAVQAGLTTLDDLLAFDATNGAVGALLGTTRTDMAQELAELRREEQSAVTLAARERAHLQAVADAQGEAQAQARVIQANFQTRGVGGPGPTPEERLAHLARLEHLAAIEAHLEAKREQLSTATSREERGQAARELNQLRLRRDGLEQAINDPNARPEDDAQFDGSRFIVDSTEQAWDYYYNGAPQDVSGATYGRTPVVLGPEHRNAVMNSPEVQAVLADLMAGNIPEVERPDTDDPRLGLGYFPIDLTSWWPSDRDTHLGRGSIGWASTPNPDGTISTRFTFSPTGRDGFVDPKVWPWAPAIVGELFDADGLGPNAEFGDGQPFPYVPFEKVVTYPDHGKALFPPGTPSHRPSPRRPGVDPTGSSGGPRTDLDSPEMMEAFYSNERGLNLDAVGLTPASFTTPLEEQGRPRIDPTVDVPPIPAARPPSHVPGPARPPSHVPGPQRPVDGAVAVGGLGPTRQRAFLESLESELDDWAVDELVSGSVQDDLGAGGRRVVETGEGHRYGLTPLGNGLVEVDYGNSREIFDRGSIRRAIDELKSDLDHDRLRSGPRQSKRRQLADLEALVEVAESPPALASFDDFHPESPMEVHAGNVTGGRFETNRDDANDFSIVGGELNVGDLQARAGVIRGDTDDSGSSYSASVAELEYDNYLVQALSAEGLFGTVRSGGVETSGANVGLTLLGAKEQAAFGTNPDGVDAIDWAGGATVGPGGGFTLERADPDHDGRMNSRFNLNMGGNLNWSWEADETHFQGLMPGSRPFRFHPRTGTFEPTTTETQFPVGERVRPRSE